VKANRYFYLILVLILIATGCKKKPSPITTPLHLAAKSGDVEQIQSLISEGANVNEREGFEYMDTPSRGRT